MLQCPIPAPALSTPVALFPQVQSPPPQRTLTKPPRKRISCSQCFQGARPCGPGPAERARGRALATRQGRAGPVAASPPRKSTGALSATRTPPDQPLATSRATPPCPPFSPAGRSGSAPAIHGRGRAGPSTPPRARSGPAGGGVGGPVLGRPRRWVAGVRAQGTIPEAPKQGVDSPLAPVHRWGNRRPGPCPSPPQWTPTGALPESPSGTRRSARQGRFASLRESPAGSP